VFKLGVYACLGLFVGWVLLLILQLWFSFIEAELFIKITLTMAGLFVIILAALLVCSQYFSEKKMKDDGFIN
jgi:putative membrane protein